MWPRRAHNKFAFRCLTGFFILSGILFFSACQPKKSTDEAERLNGEAYAWHYRSLDSAEFYARKALDAAVAESGFFCHNIQHKAEALNNLAFVSIARMDYNLAHRQLDSIDTNNEIELLIADVQRMRLCQRMSENKSFYGHREQALRRLRRITQDRHRLTAHQQQRLAYARSEFHIVESAYFYYVGLTQSSIDALRQINPNGEVAQDTAQFLNYLYNVGSGGIIVAETPEAVAQQEFDYLMRCYLMAIQADYPFFEAQALQALSEHLQRSPQRDRLMEDNLPAMKFINQDQMPDSLLAGNLAQRALDIFSSYGDVYQTAGAYRTLAECFWEIHDYQSAEICLNNALNKDTIINRAPDLVASIREQLSLVYSAVNDKPSSDYNRNVYLDMQECTRQDRQLEARAELLQQSSRQLNMMIAAVVMMIVLVILLLVAFDRMRRKGNRRFSIERLMLPLKQWRNNEEKRIQEEMKMHEEVCERIAVERRLLLNNRIRNLEQRAKLALVCSVTPFIDRIIHEVQRLTQRSEDESVRQERILYISELTDKINDYNNVLTNWIQLRQGELSLHVESFALQPLFDIVARGRMSFQLKGIDLRVHATSSVVKADKTLTLFMLNTLADNARKFTAQGGNVTISSQEGDGYVEIMVEDTGCGLSTEQLSHLFDYKPIVDEQAQKENPNGGTAERSHGFGLMNCKGIIEKYKKTSQIFSVCRIDASSVEGEGSRFSFRLPKGVLRTLTTIMFFFYMLAFPFISAKAVSPQQKATFLQQAQVFADSAYFANVNGEYQRTLLFADSCIHFLNLFHQNACGAPSALMMRTGTAEEKEPAEIRWLRDSVKTDYQTILDIRNETAVAALALHDWALYHYNNKAYTSLFRQLSADRSLEQYCVLMQKSESNKMVAVCLLIVLLVLIVPAYYILYYRHRLYYRYHVERINAINRLLLSDCSAQEKLSAIDAMWMLQSGRMKERFPTLDNIVGQIRSSIQSSIESEKLRHVDLELVEDDLHRIQYEHERLYVSNNVLDNCLSTLKHETMYYPSRIRQLIDGSMGNMEPLAQIVAYYKDLYSYLCRQALRQVEKPLVVDDDLLNYMLDLLEKLNNGHRPPREVVEKNNRYVRVRLRMDHLNLTEEQCSRLFTPLTMDVRFLICRQFVREMGELYNARACGIQATLDQQTTVIEITMINKYGKI